MSWISESANKGRKLKDMFNLSGVDVFIKDRTPDNIDDDFVFNYISARIPFHLTRGIDVIYIGKFPDMARREINAFYEDGAIYVTNDQEEEMDMIDDIIHELAHADLYNIIHEMYDVPEGFLNDIEYNKVIDDFLYRTIGYEILNQMVANIFVSGYAATSVSEYFARGFEEYFIGDKDSLRKMSPVLYKIIDELVHMEDE
ncbi:MAG: hypothetical protein ACW97P_10195 [Candidatus Hodarchaeales archaeon]|jgi:hypothetical protein